MLQPIPPPPSGHNHALPSHQADNPNSLPMPLRSFLRQTGDLLRASWSPSLWVEATVLAVKPNARGHTLELVDSDINQAGAGQLRAFLSDAKLIAMRADLGPAFMPQHLAGMAAVLLLAPSFHPKWHLQAEVLGLAKSLHPGIAARVTAEARDRLRREGLLDRQKKLAAPADVTRLAVIHPAGAAGFADIERELRRWQDAGILQLRSIPVPFEGPQAVACLIAALAQAAQPAPGLPRPDLILLVRGGGAKSGLSQLDDESLARAIAMLPVAVVTGLGHATDRALADDVAWKMADTPSKALAVVQGLIFDAARRAEADIATIHRATADAIARADADLASSWLRICDARERRINAFATSLATVWSAADIEIAATGERLARCSDDLDRTYRDIAASAEPALRQAEAAASRQMALIVSSARSRINAAPSSDRLLSFIEARAGQISGDAAQTLDRALHDLTLQARSHLAQQDTSLQQAAMLVEAADPAAILRRGFVLVSDRNGQLLTTSSLARQAGDLLLKFGDGQLAAIVDVFPILASGTQP